MTAVRRAMKRVQPGRVARRAMTMILLLLSGLEAPPRAAGSVSSQGDTALGGPPARAAFGVDGSGVTVAILSDSFDCTRTGLASDQASGDLPAATTLLDDTGCPASDRGRALAQIVHDVAPGAAILFHAAPQDEAAAAALVLELAATGQSRVLLLDLAYPMEPFFQDGLLAQAVNAAAADVIVLAPAGDRGRRSYGSPYRPSGMSLLFDGDAHDFDPGPGVDISQQVTIPVDGSATLILQWDEPFASVSGPPGSASDIDFCLMDDPPVNQLACGAEFNAGGDPVETLTFANDGTFGTVFNVVIELFEGPPPGRISLVVAAGDMQFVEHAAPGPTLSGHAQAEGAFSLASTFYFDTPAYGQSPALVATASSRGGMPILFDESGTRLPAPVLRAAPRATAPDGGNTTFFGVDIPDPGDKSDKDSWPNFFGTAAGAAHAAGLAALILQRNGALSPGEVAAALTATALDMDDPDTAGFDTGHDAATGFGLLTAAAALAAVPECGNQVVELPEQCDDGNSVDDDACGNDCLANSCGDGTVHAALGEECDDGNGEDGDFCRNDCLWNRCGDGRLTTAWVGLLANGDFETGTLAGWTLHNLGAGTFQPAAPGADTPVSRFPTAAFPGGGAFYALTDQTDSGTHTLEQGYVVPAGANRLTLSFDMFVNDLSSLGGLVDPVGLDHTGPPNQHARVDILAPGAAPYDTGAGVLANLYLGVDAGASPHLFSHYTFDLVGVTGPGTAGVVRFAEVDNQYFQHVGVDNVHLLAGLSEQCDDGNLVDGDGCSAACELEGCPPASEPQGLAFAADGVTLAWGATPDGRYDLLRAGAPATFHDPGGASGLCLAPDTASTSAVDPDIPPPGAIFSYLVRGRNACGGGTWGRDSAAASERRSEACP